MNPCTGPERAFALEPVGSGRFRGPSVESMDRTVVFGGQLLGQALTAAATHDQAKRVRQVDLTFVRPGTTAKPVDVSSSVVKAGRSLTLVRVSLSQGERELATGQVILDAHDVDLIQYQRQMPAVPVAERLDARAPDEQISWTPDEVRADGTSSEPELDVWVRWPGTRSSETREQALLAWHTVPYSIAAALLPHPWIGPEMAHRELSTGVLSQTVVFHRPISARSWHLVRSAAPYAGGGRVCGQGQVWAADGVLAASFLQLAMVRPMPESSMDSATADRL